MGRRAVDFRDRACGDEIALKNDEILHVRGWRESAAEAGPGLAIPFRDAVDALFTGKIHGPADVNGRSIAEIERANDPSVAFASRGAREGREDFPFRLASRGGGNRRGEAREGGGCGGEGGAGDSMGAPWVWGSGHGVNPLGSEERPGMARGSDGLFAGRVGGVPVRVGIAMTVPRMGGWEGGKVGLYIQGRKVAFVRAKRVTARGWGAQVVVGQGIENLEFVGILWAARRGGVKDPGGGVPRGWGESRARRGGGALWFERALCFGTGGQATSGARMLWTSHQWRPNWARGGAALTRARASGSLGNGGGRGLGWPSRCRGRG